ncbi:MAG: AAA family ATPase, partial [bacterium]
LEGAREIHEAQREEREGKALDLRQAINELDMQLFEARESIPVDVQQAIDEGLTLARRATAEEKWFDAVRDYLDEVRYRMERDSWPLDKLQEAGRRLEDSMAVGAQEKSALGAEEVLSLFERGELEQLGLRPIDIPPSRIRTRTRLLHHWLEVANLPAFRSESLGPSERASIKNLFSDFAQMIVMDRVEAPTSTAFEEPVVYSYWKLRYHKVDALKRNCIFIALPGDSPSGKDLSELDHILEEKEWLDYWYVFLFVPGGTPAQLDRLRSTYRGDRLVIIDEPALLDMVLAEVEGSKPLWRLRPLMLRAWGAEKADIFLVNESISLRTGIFVGRGDLIQRVASSGSDYALYGGRRIGKSSVLKEVERHLQRGQEVQVLAASFEGDRDLSDDAVARKIARRLQLDSNVREVGDLKEALQTHLESQPKSQIVLLLDEIDRYIEENPERHVFIEALRALSEQYGSRFRVVIAGFMGLYDCLHGRGPYSPASDPWGRMLDDLGPLPNLRPENAEEIVEEGFTGILGWDFEIPVIPQRIVRHTGGHPSFVQYFCRKLQTLVGRRRDRIVRLADIEDVFNDAEAESFIDHVKSTLRLNLDAVGEFLIPWLAYEFGDAQSFTRDQMRELADISQVEIPDELLTRSLERLTVTKVVEERTPQVFEFSVPDYPLILNRLGGTADLERAERKLQARLDGEE